MADPLHGRPGLQIDARDGRALGKDVGILAKAHGLVGCVLISFKGDRVGVNSSGEGDFAAHMETLGDRILAAIDDGQFDPDVGDTK